MYLPKFPLMCTTVNDATITVADINAVNTANTVNRFYYTAIFQHNFFSFIVLLLWL